ncbi:MAG: hypothetical protein ABSG59_03605 [Verrucomicrobiota bacterium]|jgi:hypothetical protein
MSSAQDVNIEAFPLAAANMFLAYDTAETGRSALALLDHVAADLKRAVALHASLWRFDLMTLSESAPQAAADAADADVMLVAFGANDPVPATLFQWLVNWAEHRQIKDAALGVLPTGAATRQTGVATIASLRRLAQRHGLGFICRNELGKDVNLPALAPPPARWNPAPPMQFTSPGQNVPLSEWGIND